MQSMKCDKHMAHDGKVGCNTIEYTMACLCSDWLYFLLHGKKDLGTTLGLRVKKLVSKLKKKKTCEWKTFSVCNFGLKKIHQIWGPGYLTWI